MGVAWTIRYHAKIVTEDISRLSTADKQRIRTAIEQKIGSEPDVFGILLRRSLKGYRKLRVGDYRIIFQIKDAVIKILVIQHRSVIYKNTGKRLD